MPVRPHLTIGSAPGCEILIQAPGVAPQHARLLWRDGLHVQDLGTGGQTSVDGRPLAPQETVQLAGFHAAVMVGNQRVPLMGKEVSMLFVERSPLPPDSSSIVIGRDPSRAHIIVNHPTVSGAHLRIDLNGRTVVDLGSRSGTFDRASQRLPVQQSSPLDTAGGYFFGAAWVPTAAIFELMGINMQGMGAGPQGAALPSNPGMPNVVQGGPVSAVGVAGNNPFAGYPPSQMGVSPSQHPPNQSTVAVSGMSIPGLQAAISAAGAQPPQAPKAGPLPGAKAKTMFGTFNLEELANVGKKEVILGRLPTNDIVLPYPQLSARHASLTKTPDGRILVTDLGSTNGTYVHGARLAPGQGVPVNPGEKIFLGPYPIKVDIQGGKLEAYVEQDQQQGGGEQWGANLVEIEALDLYLKVPDRDNVGKDKILLNHVTFKMLPGDLVALMGPSGAGKTTLLTVLNGYLRPTSGEVRINGENLYAIYDALRGSIGYVPQDDIVHPELTVWEAIKYSAQFRLPPDYSEDEINRRVEQTIKDLGLESVKNLQIGKPEKKVLSGGQRKRVNIALELVTDPALMFLDEPTSGLAADDTVALIDLLNGLAKKYGKTIIVTIHQPAREEYEKFNLSLIMGFGGEPVYFGPTGKESYDFFGRYVASKGTVIDNPRDMFDLLKKREEDLAQQPQFQGQPKPIIRLEAARVWRREFYETNHPTQAKMYSGRRQPGQPGQSRPPSRAKVPLMRQFRLLLKRYATVKMRDTAGTVIMLAQAPIIGILLALVFMSPDRMPNMWCRLRLEQLDRIPPTTSPLEMQQLQGCLTNPDRFPRVADFGSAIFFLVVAAIWFGTSNAAREIVSEQAIYRRERMVNLSIFNYMMSKFVLLSVVCVIQCVVLLGIVYPIVGLGNGSFASFVPMLGILILTAMTAVAIGLLLSSVVTSAEAAMALTPIALIPQVVLGGRLVPMTSKSWLEPVMAIIPARWSFEGVIGIERDAVADAWRIPTCVLRGANANNGIEVASNGTTFFHCALEEVRNTTRGVGGLGFRFYDQPAITYGVMCGMIVGVLILVSWLLRRRDSV